MATTKQKQFLCFLILEEGDNHLVGRSGWMGARGCFLDGRRVIGGIVFIVLPPAPYRYQFFMTAVSCLGGWGIPMVGKREIFFDGIGDGVCVFGNHTPDGFC